MCDLNEVEKEREYQEKLQLNLMHDVTKQEVEIGMMEFKKFTKAVKECCCGLWYKV